MLRIEEVRPKSYEERINEAIADIPLYSSEWTNFNPSDPGITVLENLSAFTALQASNVPNVPFDALRRLLLVAGFRAEKGKCARVLLKADGLKETLQIPQNARFALGGLVFETNRCAMAGGKMLGIYSDCGKGFEDISYLSKQDVPVGCAAFGEKPEAGNAVYFVTDSLPEEDKEFILYVNLVSDHERNPFSEKADNLFAAVRWEIFTGDGFEEAKVRDFTGCFLTNGEIRIRIPAGVAKYTETPEKGYCIRAVLERADYDIAPRLSMVESFLFEIWQKDTKAASIIFNRGGKINVKHPLCGDEYIIVFAKEEKGSSYRRYELVEDNFDEGRYVKFIRGGYSPEGKLTGFTIEFMGQNKPDTDLKDPVRVVLYDQDVMRQYQIGQVLGYDGQEFKLPMEHLVFDSFSLIARRTLDDGSFVYDFVRPEKKGDGALFYHLLEDEGRIVIEDAGRFIGADLFVASMAVTAGEKGNVRAMSRFTPLSKMPKAQWFNPGAGTLGSYREKLADVAARFRTEVNSAYTAVTSEDYERIALSTPGLCLRKAHAVIDEAENLVSVAVCPGTEGERPVLSDSYRDEIARRLEDRRLLTTRVHVVSPRYVDIHVRGTVYVKRHYANPKKTIVDEIRKLIDDVHSNRDFGEPLRFREIFAAIEALDCVSYVYELSMIPDDRNLAEYKDSDIYPEADVLCMAGDIMIETVTGE